jgi:hypothetical protein
MIKAADVRMVGEIMEAPAFSKPRRRDRHRANASKNNQEVMITFYASWESRQT